MCLRYMVFILKGEIVMANENTEDLTLLGNQDVKYAFDYDPGVLETFDNKFPDRDYFVKFNCPEFTTLCPITNQPRSEERRVGNECRDRGTQDEDKNYGAC